MIEAMTTRMLVIREVSVYLDPSLLSPALKSHFPFHVRSILLHFIAFLYLPISFVQVILGLLWPLQHSFTLVMQYTPRTESTSMA